MEVMEILIFLGFAVIVGVLMLGFIADWDYLKTYEDMKVLFREEEKLEFKKVNTIGFAKNLYTFFTECRQTGFNMSLVLYVEDNRSLTKEELFTHYKSLGWCESIQSLTYDCGVREDIIMSTIDLPKIVRINCTNSTLYIT